MKEKFTSGQWVVVDGTKVDEQVLFVHAPEIDGVICRLTHVANKNIPLSDADIANAHLIAAAPKMYAMLEAIYVTGMQPTEAKLKNLLAEARGEL